MADDQLVPTTGAPPAAVEPKTPVRFGMIPRTIDEAWRVAMIFAKSGIVPDAMRDKPENVFVAMQLGAELGLSPTNAVQTIMVVNGRAVVFGDGFGGVIRSSPVFEAIEEWFEADRVEGEDPVTHKPIVVRRRVEALTDDDLKNPTTAAVCSYWRRGVEQPTTRRFSIADARRANLINKAGPWREYPQRMLMFRAREFAGRDLFPDVLKGLGAGESATDAAEAEVARPTVRRISESAPAPAVNVITLDPAHVVAELREQVIKLDNGYEVEVDDAADLAALVAAIGTEARVRCTVERAGTAWRLQRWTLVEVDEGIAHARE